MTHYESCGFLKIIKTVQLTVSSKLVQHSIKLIQKKRYSKPNKKRHLTIRVDCIINFYFYRIYLDNSDKPAFARTVSLIYLHAD